MAAKGAIRTGCFMERKSTIQRRRKASRVSRRGKLLFTGPIATIRHFKETVKEVKQAQECGILLDGFGDFEEGDVLECFAFEELPKSL